MFDQLWYGKHFPLYICRGHRWEHKMFHRKTQVHCNRKQAKNVIPLKMFLHDVPKKGGKIVLIYSNYNPKKIFISNETTEGLINCFNQILIEIGDKLCTPFGP